MASSLTDTSPISSTSSIVPKMSGMQSIFEDQPTPDTTPSLPVSRPTPHRHHRTNGEDPTMPRFSLRGKPRAQFLQNIPAHEYKLPKDRPINATIVDVIVILPQWFRNPGIIWRFLNNGINAAVHFAILEQHRHLSLANTEEAERARDHISDTYRKTMRKMEGFAGWKKANHNVPDDWNKLNISISNYLPETAKKIDYITPKSVPFKDLAIGLKSLPQGYDAGDLTRALDFAMQNQKLDEHGRPMEFMFPDDIQLILAHIGPTHVTQGHVDGAILGRYFRVLRAADGVRRRQIAEQRRQQQAADEAAVKFAAQSPAYETPWHQEGSEGCSIRRSPLEATSLASSMQLQLQLTANSPTSSRGYEGMPPAGMGVLMPTTLHHSSITQESFGKVPQSFAYDQSQDSSYGITARSNAGYSSPSIPHPVRSKPQDVAATAAAELVVQGTEQAYTDLPDLPEICKFETDDQKSPFNLGNWSHLDPQRATEKMDALMAAHQTYDLSGFPSPVPHSPQARYPYHSSTLLRDCPEGLDLNDHSDLARASRWARQWRSLSDELKFGDIDLVLTAMSMSEVMDEPGEQ